jgi:hypothetical protein
MIHRKGRKEHTYCLRYHLCDLCAFAVIFCMIEDSSGTR